MQITPYKILNYPAYNNINRNVQYPRFNVGLQKDTVSFSSTVNKKDYKELMYKQWDARMAGWDGVITRFHCIEGYDEALKKFDVKDFIRLGGESAVFELNDGNILKLSTEKYPPHIEKYHAPEVDRGAIQLSQKYTARNNTPSQRFDTDKIYYLIQKKGVPMTRFFDGTSLSLKFSKEAEKDGFLTSDFATEQFACFYPDSVTNIEEAIKNTPTCRDFNKVKNEIRCIDLGCITEKNYPISREFEAIERMTPSEMCKPYGLTFFTLKKYYPDIFNDSDKTNDYLRSISPRINEGENIFDVMNEELAKYNKEPLEHIKLK